MSFRVARHSRRNEEIVEVLLDNKVVAVVYPKDRNGIRILSAHIAGMKGTSLDIVPAEIELVFEPRPWALHVSESSD